MLTTNQEVKYHRVVLNTPIDIEEFLKDVITILDKLGKKYKHSVPWRDEFCANPKFYSYRVKIGAVGRISTCRHAIEVGMNSRAPMSVVTFVSKGHYSVFRFARTVRQLELYGEDISLFINVVLGSEKEKYKNLLFVNMDW